MKSNMLVWLMLICFILINGKQIKQIDMMQRNILDQFSSEIKTILEENIPFNLKFNSCKSCQVVFNLLDISKMTEIKDKLRQIAIFFCNTFMDTQVCDGIMGSFTDSFLDNFFAGYLTQDHVCIFLKVCENPNMKVDFEAWKKKVLADKPDDQSKNRSMNPKKFRVLHLTDLHTDLQYEVGSLADCEKPFCCHLDSGVVPTDEKRKAQYWGSNAKCDIPLHTVEALLADSRNKGGDIDMIIWTGDNTSHDVWHQTKANQTLPQLKVSELINKYYPTVPKYPIFGNHECFPSDQYDFSKEDQTRWMRVESAEMWKTWLQPDALESLINHGVYSQYNKDTNMRVIALNTQACDNLNFYLIQNNTDPANELEFLRNQLYLAESNQQKVFIIGHIPPGDYACSSQWSQRIQVLVDRFENTIVGQFFGHSHNDQIEVVKSARGKQKSVGTIFIAPSGSTYSYQNPSYRIFSFEDEKMTNYFQYRLDLDKANRNKDITPVWDLAYDFKSEYGLQDVSNDQIYELAFNKLRNDPSLLKKYVSNYWTGSQQKTPQIIDASVRDYFTCLAQNIVFNDRFQCIGVYALITHPDELLFKFLESLQGQWQIKQSK